MEFLTIKHVSTLTDNINEYYIYALYVLPSTGKKKIWIILNHKAQQAYLNFYVNVLNGNLPKMHYLLSCLVKQHKMNIN